ncbi:hypothetical protein ACIBO6_01015 [Streptomyces luteogriseus]|uniref:hypothetical protein n=1 Tax=Streptomyces luteogriseus TaxID=68233 RepID=UPI00378BF3BD
MCAGYFMVILDVTVINVAVPVVGWELSASLTGIQWITGGYTLVFGGFLLTGGALGTGWAQELVVEGGLEVQGPFLRLPEGVCGALPGEEVADPGGQAVGVGGRQQGHGGEGVGLGGPALDRVGAPQP